MAALSSASVVPAIAQPSTFSSPRLLTHSTLLFSSAGHSASFLPVDITILRERERERDSMVFKLIAGKEGPFLTISRTASRVSSRPASFVLPIYAAVKEVDVSKVVPQADRVLIRLEQLPEKSLGGVLLPKSAAKFEHYLCGEVLSAGKEATGVNVGQKVLFSDLNAYEVNFGTSEKLCFCKSGDLLAFVE